MKKKFVEIPEWLNSFIRSDEVEEPKCLQEAYERGFKDGKNDHENKFKITEFEWIEMTMEWVEANRYIFPKKYRELILKALLELKFKNVTKDT